MNKYLLYPLIFSFLFVFPSCKGSVQSGLEQTLDKREQAFESKDLNLYMSLIDPEYGANSGADGETLESLRKSFTGISHFFDKLTINTRDRAVYIEGDRARVIQDVLVLVRMEQEKIETSFVMKETISLRRKGDDWLITKEAEDDYAEGFVFGGNK